MIFNAIVFENGYHEASDIKQNVNVEDTKDLGLHKNYIIKWMSLKNNKRKAKMINRLR